MQRQDGWTDRQTGKQAGKQTQTDRYNGSVYRQGRWTNRQIDRQTDREVDRQTGM